MEKPQFHFYHSSTEFLKPKNLMLYRNPEFVIFKEVHFTNCVIQKSKYDPLVFLNKTAP